jgi:large subunit ribosomal protein L20
LREIAGQKLSVSLLKDAERVLYAALGFLTSGDSCQAVPHGCLQAETAAIHFAALDYPGTNPLRNAICPRCRNLFCFRETLNHRGVFGLCCGRFFNPVLFTPTRQVQRSKPMARVKRGTKRRARRKKYLKRTKGFFLTKSKLYQSAQEAANRADRYAFRDRRVKKRQYRRLWIQRIGAAARANGITYGQLIHGLKAAGIALDRKVLADIAVKDAAGFTQLAERAKASAPKPAAKKAK